MLKGSKYKETDVPSFSQSDWQAETLKESIASEAQISKPHHKRGRRIERNPKRDEVGRGRKGQAA
jgi:hypothetical protein